MAERFLPVDPISRIYETTEKEERKLADAFVSKHFNETVQSHNDGYYAQYAMKPVAQDELPDNYNLAVSRLASTRRSLSTDRNLLSFYDSIIQDQLSLGQIELVDPSDNSGIIHYLAHQPVLRPDRLRPYLIVADVEKAFLQVKLCPSQRNMLRFLWLKDIDKPATPQNILTLRFCVTPFGVDQSPCLLNKIINHHSMAINLRDYSSNSPSFMEAVSESDRSKDTYQKLLGLTWNTETDTLSIKIPISAKRETESKRTMLSTVSSSYDPLGFLNPLLLPPRLSVQSLWNNPLKWDEAVDDHINRYSHISVAQDIILIAFSDASKQAMAASIYSYVPGDSPVLLIAKTRLAPIQSNSTIPKM
ncbi:hypothetical protein PMAYCL1PPCAC_09216, partial [Pristionchus mayeri]